MADILSALRWYISILLIGIIAFPITFRFLSRLPGKGYAFSKPLGLLLWGYLFWFFGELHIIQNDIGGELLALGIVLCVSVFFLRNGNARQLWQWVRENWKTVLTIEIVFLVFFAVWAWVRSVDPNITGTEKPMEQAFINAILDSPSFPPRDPWLAEYAISYYYFGYVLIAMLIRVSGVVTGVGYNLASASWFALTAAAAFGLIIDLVAFWKRGKDNPGSNVFTAAQKALGRWAGILGSFFILIVSNLEGLLEMLHSCGLFWKVSSEGTWTSKFWSWLGLLDLSDAPVAPFNCVPSRYLVWWRGSRVVRDMSISGGGIEIIDEFPFFSYLLSDLHPHVLAMPFDLLAMAICLNLFIAASEASWPIWKPLEWLKTWEFWLTALVLGSMAFFNTWDFPIYLGLFCLVLIYLKVKQVGWSGQRVWDFLAACLIYGLAGVLLFLPFFLGFKSQAGGFLPSLEFVTRTVQYWVMFAPLLIPIFFWLFHVWRNSPTREKFNRGGWFAFYLIGGLWLAMTLIGAFIFSVGNSSATLAASVNPTLAALGSKLNSAFNSLAGIHGTTDGLTVFITSMQRRVIYAGTWITLTALLVLTWGLIASGIKRETVREVDDSVQENPALSLNANTFVLFLVLIGIGLSGIPEFFYLRDTFGTRMNTIFKFYFQTWIFWGIAAAYATVVLWRELKGARQIVFTTLWIVVFMSSLMYPIFMLHNKLSVDFSTPENAKLEVESWTLDGNAYIDRYYPDEAAAIAWLSSAPDGIIAEAIGGSYSEYGRFSELTGKQTVLMWPGHEMQWRGGLTEMGTREEDIRKLYESPYWFSVRDIIARYNIRYIVVGSFERNAYDLNSVKFSSHLNIVFQNNTVTIYEVPASIRGGD